MKYTVNSPKAQAAGFLSTFTLEFDAGVNLATATEKFGEDIVFNGYQNQIKTEIGNKVRAKLDAQAVEGAPEVTEEELVEFVDSWVPGQRGGTVVTRTMAFNTLMSDAGSGQLSQEQKNKLAAMLAS